MQFECVSIQNQWYVYQSGVIEIDDMLHVLTRDIYAAIITENYIPKLSIYSNLYG